MIPAGPSTRFPTTRFEARSSRSAARSAATSSWCAAANRRTKRPRLPPPQRLPSGGWHIVVEGEQVGPISEADVRARVERGEIRGDTYIWKEGFADWLKLSAVPEFARHRRRPTAARSTSATCSPRTAPLQRRRTAAASAAAAAASGANRPLFGDGGGGADVFAAPAAAAPRVGRRSVRLGERAFDARRTGAGVQRAAVAAAPSMAGHDGGRVENLTGQRHENSVLFSLSNLQSLAMPSAKPLDDARLPTTAPTTEGLGPDRHSRDGGQHAPARASDGPTATHGRRSAGVRRVLAGGARAAADAGVERPALVDLPGHRRHARPGRRHRLPRVARDRPEAGRGRRRRCQVPAPAPRAVEDGRREDARCRGQEADHDRREGSAAARGGKDAKEAQGRQGREGRQGEPAPQGSSGGGKESKKVAAAATRRRPPAPVAAIAEPPRPAKGSLDDLLERRHEERGSAAQGVRRRQEGGGGGDVGRTAGEERASWPA